ncbi:S-adenosylmethionine-dependent methyltransferase superfamily domain-containing protein [Anopheles sinensis]|uniref:S-adenosylmethionine-dependent methyltransferase superfamily domain-containing protein n=1 Tax=Anopheles sinensis TaxID=74873 RepID=A0A084WNG6_ANOSI|nr:S-adenosylmethionine-dependent methyltransferase superfamily domain-containing protein [Anopheles sinensis]
MAEFVQLLNYFRGQTDHGGTEHGIFTEDVGLRARSGCIFPSVEILRRGEDHEDDTNTESRRESRDKRSTTSCCALADRLRGSKG